MHKGRKCFERLFNEAIADENYEEAKKIKEEWDRAIKLEF